MVALPWAALRTAAVENGACLVRSTAGVWSCGQVSTTWGEVMARARVRRGRTRGGQSLPERMGTVVRVHACEELRIQRA